MAFSERFVAKSSVDLKDTTEKHMLHMLHVFLTLLHSGEEKKLLQTFIELSVFEPK